MVLEARQSLTSGSCHWSHIITVLEKIYYFSLDICKPMVYMKTMTSDELRKWREGNGYSLSLIHI